MIFCKINFHDEKFILVATELAAESKAKKKFWHYFASGGKVTLYETFFIYIVIQSGLGFKLFL